MLLLDIEDQIKPLSHPEKRQLFRFLMQELERESARMTDERTSEFQPAPEHVEMMRVAAREPYWDLYDAHEAAHALWEAKRSELPAI